MDRGELVSVLIPAYNVGKYLDRCLNSIVKQTYANIEIIIVIQPSEDCTEEIAHKWEEQDGRIRVIFQQIPDLAMARNNLLYNAKGKYVVFVDSDDFINVKHIEELYVIAEQKKADLVQCRCYAFKDEKYIPELNVEGVLCEQLSGRDYTYGVLSGRYGSDGGVIQTKLYLKKLFDGIYFPQMRVCEDMAVTYQITWKAQKVVVYNAQTYYYQSQRKDSITHHAQKKIRVMSDGLWAVYEQIIFFEKRDEAIYNEAVYNICNRIMKLKYILKKTGNNLENEGIKKILHNHKKYVKIVIHSKLSKAKKTITLMGYWMPTITYFIWSARKEIKSRREWKEKR